jgi:hypothetical protein
MENMGFICWAENGREAKKLGVGNDALGDCCEFIDIRVRRCPLADELFAGEVIADWFTEAGQRVYWKVGCIWPEASHCVQCYEPVFDKVPESHLNDDGFCAECAAELLELELLEDEILGGPINTNYNAEGRI